MSSAPATAIINVKTDRRLKREAQSVSRELGLPLSAIVNAYLRDFVREKKVVFSSHPVPNQKTRRFLERIRSDRKGGKNIAGPFTYDEAIAYLDAE